MERLNDILKSEYNIKPKFKARFCSSCGSKKICYENEMTDIVNIKHKDLYIVINLKTKEINIKCTNCASDNIIKESELSK